MIFVVGSLKGGVGKTTMTTNIAAQLQALGYSVSMVEGNGLQGSLRGWAQDRNADPDFPDIQFFEHNGDDFGDYLVSLENNCDIVIADTGGQDSIELRSALRVADLFVTPMIPDVIAARTVPFISELISTFREFNPELEAKLFFNKVPTHIFDDRLNRSRELINQIDGLSLEVMRSIVSDRKLYSDAFAIGAGVVELGSSKPSNEVQLLCQELFDL